ncbi:fluoride efflux transporter FluC, partial [Mammaliicoccus lentus]
MIGSGVGAVLRHMTNQIISKFFTQSFPFATLIVNVVGSFIIGLCAQYIAESSH